MKIQFKDAKEADEYFRIHILIFVDEEEGIKLFTKISEIEELISEGETKQTIEEIKFDTETGELACLAAPANSEFVFYTVDRTNDELIDRIENVETTARNLRQTRNEIHQKVMDKYDEIFNKE